MEEVAHDNADVVFTTSIRMRPACLKVAAQHPKTRFLNCCLNARPIRWCAPIIPAPMRPTTCWECWRVS